MKTDELLKKLYKKIEYEEPLHWLSSYTDSDYCSFRQHGPPKGDVSIQQIGLWLSVTVEIRYSGSTMDPSTDRARGDPYSALVIYDWIGHADTVPKVASSSDILDEWALYKSNYSREYTSSGSWGVHEGSWVVKIEEDGTVTYREAAGDFQDVSPESVTEEKIIKLEL
jgi:hypothetical protein